MSRNTATARTGRRGVGQFCERMEEFWWAANELSQHDTGEDVAIKIFDEPIDDRGERPSGLAFHAQVKSTEEPDVAVGGMHASASLKIEHLEDWERSNIPIVVFVWDVAARKGCWRLATEICAELSKQNDDWHALEQQKISVKFLLADSTDDAGLNRLRMKLVGVSMPSIAKGREPNIKVKFSLPKPLSDEFIKAQDLGTPFVIDASRIKSVQTDEWYERMIGKKNLEVGSITINSKPPDKTFAARLLSTIGSDTEVIPLTLKTVRAGRVEMEFSNRHDAEAPLWIDLVLRDGECSFSSELNDEVILPSHRYNAISFLARAQRAAQVHVHIKAKSKWVEFGGAQVPGLRSEIQNILEGMKALRELEPFVRFLKPIDIGGLEDPRAVDMVRALAAACVRGEPLTDASVVFDGVKPEVRDDPNPEFRFDMDMNMGWSMLRFKRAYLYKSAAGELEFEDSAKHPGKLRVTLTEFHIGFRGRAKPASQAAQRREK